MKVRWLKQGVASLGLVEHYIAAENPAAGRRIVDLIEAAAERLSIFPLLGRIGVVHSTRELIVPGTSYLVVYAVADKEVWILRVFHCKQLIQ
jgi:toxin ParE1/3/4